MSVRSTTPKPVPLPVERHLLRARDFADAHYAEPVTVRDLAAIAGMSRAHFSRSFKGAFGESPHQYVITRRLERAAHLLRATDRSISEICFGVGASSLGSFSTSFRRIYGMTPGRYRASFPPAASYARIPPCIALAFARPKNRTFREERAGSPS